MTMCVLVIIIYLILSPCEYCLYTHVVSLLLCIKQTRALRTVAFLSIPSPASTSGYLWLIDTTGVYCLRAHAIGQHAKSLNSQLQQINFDTMCVQQAKDYLLELVEKEEKLLRERNTPDDTERIKQECRYWNDGDGSFQSSLSWDTMAGKGIGIHIDLSGDDKLTHLISPTAVEYVHVQWKTYDGII